MMHGPINIKKRKLLNLLLLLLLDIILIIIIIKVSLHIYVLFYVQYSRMAWQVFNRTILWTS